MSNSEKIELVALAAIKLHLSKGISQCKIFTMNVLVIYAKKQIKFDGLYLYHTFDLPGWGTVTG